MEHIRSKLAATVSELQSCHSEVERERAAHLQQLDELASNYAQRDTSAQTQLQNSLQAIRSEHEAEISTYFGFIRLYLTTKESHRSNALTIGRLRDQIEQFEREREKIQAECDEKLSKAQAFFEHELEVARHTANTSLESEAERSEQSRKDMERLVAEARQREERLRERAVGAEDELERTRHRNGELDSSVQSLQAQLCALNEQLAAAERRLTDTETLRTQNSQQLESTLAEKQSVLSALNDQLSSLRTQLSDSERSRKEFSQKATELERNVQEKTAKISSLDEVHTSLNFICTVQYS